MDREIWHFDFIPPFLLFSLSDCGISVFYTHRESRHGNGVGEGKSTFSSNNTNILSSSSSNYVSSSKRSSKHAKKGMKSSRRTPRSPIDYQQSASTRRTRANSRVMKWKSKSPTIEGPLARIVGGTVAQPYSWPWQISLQLRHPTMGFIGHWW